MIDSGEGDAWDESDFEAGYLQFDKDGSGQIEREEFDAFVKRFADLWRDPSMHNAEVKMSRWSAALTSETLHLSRYLIAHINAFLNQW